MNTLGAQAKAASALMARASAATKRHALTSLAALLRANVDGLQVENAKDLERARAAGLAEPMVDRLKLTPPVIEICAQGCEQLAAMADVIGAARAHHRPRRCGPAHHHAAVRGRDHPARRQGLD